VRSFKAATAKRINNLRKTPGAPVWQRNYYERVIRGDRELEAVREYIVDNPRRWAEDPNNPAN
jgi:REP element-mobilizing transposase RayT